MSTCDKRNIIERLMWIYHWLCKEKYTLADLTKSIVSRDWNKEELIFSMGIENGESVYFIDKNETWREEKVTESVEKLFINSFLKDGDNTFVQYCRGIGTWKTEDQKEHKIYYFFSIHHCDGISNLYFQSIDDVYYQWIQSKVNGLMSLVDLPNDLGYEKAFEKRMYRLISDTFYEYMLENYDVDLNVITELAGSYYEGQPCRSKLVFQFGA